jgi:hypothetical protein
MRVAAVTILAASMALLTACGGPAEPPAPTEASKPAPAPAAKPEVPANAMTAKPGTPANAMMAKAPPPEGDCGDQSALAPDQRIANTARWSTASEQDSFAFDVYRGDSEKGEFKKINKDPILGAGTSDETHKYEYRDDTIDPCKDYWYYVESISTKGTHEKFTPTFHAPPKRRARGSSGDAASH